MPKEVLILHYYKSIVEGVMTSMIDLFFNLRNYFDNVKFHIICPELFSLEYDDYYNFPLNETEFTKNGEHIEFDEFKNYNNNEVTCSIPFLKYNNNFGDPKLFHSVLYKPKEVTIHAPKGSIIICSTRFLYEKLVGRLDIDFKIGCSNLFVIDSLDLYKSKIRVFPNLNIAVPNSIKECLYFSNPSNFIEGNKNIEYYHKLSKRRLDTLKPKSFDYRRSDKEKIKVKDYYFENIGKRIFESLYHGKNVNYYSDGITIKDGLYYYLKLFNINGFKNHIPLKIDKNEIEDKLFMHDDDEIIKNIERVFNEAS